MNRIHLVILISLPIFFGTVPAKPKSVRDPEAERLVRERKAQAQLLLVSLAADAGTFRDQKSRARTQVHIADAIWKNDTGTARALFRKAWVAAVR